MEYPASLVLVEDNPADIQLMRYALEQTGATVNIIHYEHGRDFLTNLDQLLPSKISCILLDLNMPFMSGHEVLRLLRQQTAYYGVPVIVFTSSSDGKDLRKAYGNGANAYVRKPLELDELCKVMQCIIDFWVHTNLRP